MASESLLGLYTTYYGWFLNNMLWQVLASTGIVFIPLIAILISSYIETSTSQEAREASTTSVRRMEVNTFIAIIVILIGAMPSMVLDIRKMNYIDHCGENRYYPDGKTTGAIVKYGATGTELDRVFASSMTVNGDVVRVPLFYYAVISISGSINASIKTSLPCAMIKANIDNIRAHVIEDGGLRVELARFQQECYEKARTLYYSRNANSNCRKGDNQCEAYKPDMPDFIQELNGLANKRFLKLSWLYPTLRAERSVAGFTPQGDNLLYAGMGDKQTKVEKYAPTCKEWWSDTNQGLQTRIQKYAKNTPALKLSLDRINNSALREAAQVWNSASEWALANRLASTTNQYSAQGVGDNTASYFRASPYYVSQPGWDNNAPNLRASIGRFLETSSIKTSMYIYRAFVPVFIAFSLLAVYFLSALPLLLSQYSLAILMAVGILIFSVMFMDSLHHIALWIDEIFYLSFYKSDSLPGINGINRYESMLLDTAQHETINIATKLLVIGLPALFAIVMSIGGYAIVTGVNSFMSQTAGNYANSAGHKATSTLESAARMLIGKLLPGMKSIGKK